MAQILYTPLGDMISTITIMDPGTTLNPDGTQPAATIFAIGIPAKATWVRSTTRAMQVGQQIVTIGSYEIVIRAQGMEALRSRMYVILQSQRGDVTLSIEQIADPDQKNVELHLICTERNDGQ